MIKEGTTTLNVHKGAEKYRSEIVNCQKAKRI